MTRYWNADSDRDWEDSVMMYEDTPEAEEEPEEEPWEVVRHKACDAFFDACAGIDDLVLRGRVRDAGMEFCHTAVRIAMARSLAHFSIARIDWSSLGLDARAANALDRAGISSIAKLRALGRIGAFRIENVGKKTLRDIEKKIGWSADADKPSHEARIADALEQIATTLIEIGHKL